MIPVYVVTGFLESGKTTFLKQFLNYDKVKRKKILLIKFEMGEEMFQSKHNNCSLLSFSAKTMDQEKEKISREIHQSILQSAYDEIWIEWNGMIPYAQLQSLLLQPMLFKCCNIEKVIHIADLTTIKSLLGNTGNALPEQISNSDFAVIRNETQKKESRQVRQLFQSINPGMGFLTTRSYSRLYEQIYVKKSTPVETFMIKFLIFLFLFIVAKPMLESMNVPFNKTIVIFIGVILQAFPFLLIGVLLSSALQIFVPNEFIERRFPKSVGVGMMMAILLGFCLPVCDCASIPVFKSLVKKGIPLPVAITFMISTPVINPVVMLSTYYAFGGNWEVIITRVGLGIISAVLIGIISSYWCSKEKVFNGGYDKTMCSCGCYDNVESDATIKGKINLFVRHSQLEFFSVAKYLVIGTVISAAFQTIRFENILIQDGTGYTISILMMMLLAFALSLCSSSDAVIARSFANQIPFGAIMGFLVFGPMMDIKNVFMLSSSFSKIVTQFFFLWECCPTSNEILFDIRSK